MRYLGLIAALAGLGAADAAEPAASYTVGISEVHPFAPGVTAYLTEAYRRVGIAIDVRLLPPARSVELANRGEIDAEAARVPDAMTERGNLIAVPEPLAAVESFAFTTGAVIPVDGWESLRPYRLCIMIGDLVAIKRTEGMERETTHDTASQFRMLKSGRCDVAISDAASWLVIDQAHLGPFRMIDKPIQTFAAYHYVNKRHADLAPALAKAFRDLREEGFTRSLLTPYLEKIADSRARNSVTP